MQRKISIAIVGFGLAGRYFHAGLLSGLTDLFTITDVVSRDADKVKVALPEATARPSIHSLRESPCECVVIATPSHTHYSAALEAIALGKHVVIDKPIAATVAQAEELIEAAHKKGVLLTVFQNRRWDSGFLTARDLVKKGVLGEILQFNVSYDRFRPDVDPQKWREQALPASGALYDLGSHLLDQACQLLGAPDYFVGRAVRQREHAMQVDGFAVQLYTGKKMSLVVASSVAASPRPCIELFGTKGTYRKVAFDAQEDRLKQGLSPSNKHWRDEDPRDYGILTLAENGNLISRSIPSIPGAYENFYTGLYRAIIEGTPVPVDPASLLTPLRIIESLTAETTLEK